MLGQILVGHCVRFRVKAGLWRLGSIRCRLAGMPSLDRRLRGRWKRWLVFELGWLGSCPSRLRVIGLGGLRRPVSFLQRAVRVHSGFVLRGSCRKRFLIWRALWGTLVFRWRALSVVVCGVWM